MFYKGYFAKSQYFYIFFIIIILQQNKTKFSLNNSYDALMRACAVRRDYAGEALTLFERMRTAGYLPTATTYDALLQAMGHGDDVAALDGTFDEARARYPDDVDLETRLLRAYATHIIAHRRQSAANAMLERAEALVAERRAALANSTATAVDNDVSDIDDDDVRHRETRARRDLAELLAAQHTLLCAANRVARAEALADAPELRELGGPLHPQRVSLCLLLRSLLSTRSLSSVCANLRFWCLFCSIPTRHARTHARTLSGLRSTWHVSSRSTRRQRRLARAARAQRRPARRRSVVAGAGRVCACLLAALGRRSVARCVAPRRSCARQGVGRARAAVGSARFAARGRDRVAHCAVGRERHARASQRRRKLARALLAVAVDGTWRRVNFSLMLLRQIYHTLANR